MFGVFVRCPSAMNVQLICWFRCRRPKWKCFDGNCWMKMVITYTIVGKLLTRFSYNLSNESRHDYKIAVSVATNVCRKKMTEEFRMNEIECDDSMLGETAWCDCVQWCCVCWWEMDGDRQFVVAWVGLSVSARGSRILLSSLSFGGIVVSRRADTIPFVLVCIHKLERKLCAVNVCRATIFVWVYRNSNRTNIYYDVSDFKPTNRMNVPNHSNEQQSDRETMVLVKMTMVDETLLPNWSVIHLRNIHTDKYDDDNNDDDKDDENNNYNDNDIDNSNISSSSSDDSTGAYYSFLNFKWRIINTLPTDFQVQFRNVIATLVVWMPFRKIHFRVNRRVPSSQCRGLLLLCGIR